MRDPCIAEVLLLLPCPPEAFVEYCKLVDAFLKYLNDNLALAVRCEVALGVLAKSTGRREVTTISKKMVDVFANNEFEAKYNSLDEIYSDHDVAGYDLIGIDTVEEEFGGGATPVRAITDARRLNRPPHGSEIMSKTLLENSLKTLSQCT